MAVAGCEQPPGINKMTVGKMGLKGVPGLKLVADQRQHNHNRNTNNNNSNQQVSVALLSPASAAIFDDCVNVITCLCSNRSITQHVP